MRLAALAVALSVLMANRSFANRIVAPAPGGGKSTAAVQRAIDETAESGGGEVSGASVIEDTPERPFLDLVFEDIALAGESSPRIVSPATP